MKIVEELKARKQEIVDYLNALEAKHKNRKRGLAEIDAFVKKHQWD